MRILANLGHSKYSYILLVMSCFHIVRFPNPLATGSDIHGSWGTWLVSISLWSNVSKVTSQCNGKQDKVTYWAVLDSQKWQFNKSAREKILSREPVAPTQQVTLTVWSNVGHWSLTQCIAMLMQTQKIYSCSIKLWQKFESSIWDEQERVRLRQEGGPLGHVGRRLSAQMLVTDHWPMARDGGQLIKAWDRVVIPWGFLSCQDQPPTQELL